jgi:hypothetical protein
VGALFVAALGQLREEAPEIGLIGIGQQNNRMIGWDIFD